MSTPKSRLRLACAARGTMAGRLPGALAEGGPRRGHDPGRIRGPGLDGVRLAGGVAAASRHLLLPARGAVLRGGRHLAAAGHRPDIGHRAARRRHRRRDGGRRRDALGGDRRPGRPGRGGPQRAGVAVAAERAGQLHQRDDPARLQGGGGADDRHDAVAETPRREGGRPPFLRTRLDPRRTAGRDQPRRARHRAGGAGPPGARRQAPPPASHRPPGRRPRHRSDVPDLAGGVGGRDGGCLAGGAAGLPRPVPAAARRGRDPPARAPPASCWPTSRGCRRPARWPPSTTT